MSFTKWSGIREQHIARMGAEVAERGERRLLAEARAHRLAEERKRARDQRADAPARHGGDNGGSQATADPDAD